MSTASSDRPEPLRIAGGRTGLPLLAGEGLVFRYPGTSPTARPALGGVDVTLGQGDIVALVGESGSGKSTLGRVLAGLYPPTSGHLSFEGKPIDASGSRPSASGRDAYHRYLRSVQLVQQDPFASFNPALKLESSLTPPLLRHGLARSKGEARNQAAHLLAQVGLVPPERYLERFPHELSGGQLQRAAIARSLTVDPLVLVADEAVTMLDVSLRLELLHLMRRLGEERNLAYVFITHDFAVTRAFAAGHTTKVLYGGVVVEEGPVEEIVERPRHPYTRALVDAIPSGDPDLEAAREAHRLRLDPVPVGTAIPVQGCPLTPRCPRRLPACSGEEPIVLRAVAPGSSHRMACLNPLPNEPALP